MCGTTRLQQVDATPSDKLFVMHGEGEKAFCAGGVRSLARSFVVGLAG